MDDQAVEAEAPVSDYWSWVAVSLYLLLPLDLLTSLYAAAAVGVEGEANPLMAWLLTQSLTTIVGVHLAVATLAVACFYWLRVMVLRTPETLSRYFAFGVQLWLGLLIAVGLVVFANNVSVIVHGRGLLG